MHKAVLQGAAAECAAVQLMCVEFGEECFHSSLLTNCAPAMRSEQFGAVHFIFEPTVNLYPMYEAFCALCFRKSLKGGLCDKNVYHNRCVFMVFRFMLTHAYFCIGVLKIWR